MDGYKIEVVSKEHEAAPREKLFFINLGGYKPDELEEFHYKLLTVSPDKGAAIQRSKQTAFYRHTGFTGATSHVDDKYGVDVDDIYEIEDILPGIFKEKYTLNIRLEDSPAKDELHLGYLKFDKL